MAGPGPFGGKLWVGEDYTVVGISRSARATKLADSVEVYLPIERANLPFMSVLVETSAPPEALARPAASAAKAIDPDLFPEVQLLKNEFRRKLRSAEYSAVAVSLLGSMAHLLACLGIVGLVAYAVSQRTKEIGIRLALGARPSHVLSVVLRQFSRPVIAGLLVGVGVQPRYRKCCASYSMASAISTLRHILLS